MTLLGTMQPTSGFGELFQYSNAMAAAAGYMAGRLVNPDMELGAAFDKAMQSYVFDPLKMHETTMDFALAQRGNFATAHAPDVDGHLTRAEARANYSVVPLRPAGAVWSSVNDMLKYVAMELAEGKLPDGTPYIDRAVLLERRAPQVVVSTDETYGMALVVDSVYGTPVVHHGGDMIGFHSDMTAAGATHIVSNHVEPLLGVWGHEIASDFIKVGLAWRKIMSPGGVPLTKA
jgi:CubicO group peptidase (beta-lactamase class C family)